MKKILLTVVALGAVALSVVGLAAFEAHVVNVTAKIENALFVPVKEINFGTVFPQEQLDKFFDVSLSQSFIDEDRVDDVDYVIRQKPKCGLPVAETNPVEYSAFGVVTENAQGEYVCVDDGYQMLPMLCPYLSKHETTTDGTDTENDGGIDAFHGPINTWTLATTIANQVSGHLVKAAGDLVDTWKVDLKTPCFSKHCAQDWEEYVLGINDTADPAAYIQPLELEHQTFGCDLWLEVTGFSLPGFGCQEELDMMLVLDRSGSINTTELQTLKDAANAFVTALAPTTAGVHIGQTSFSSTGTMDLHLTDDESAVHAAINALVSGGLTNLFKGIDLATAELDNTHEHERAVVPDVMVVITDGNPNQPIDETTARAAAAAAADAARVAGIEVYVVGVGDGVDTTYLQTEIADDVNHYFAAVDFDDLQTVLENLVACD